MLWLSPKRLFDQGFSSPSRARTTHNEGAAPQSSAARLVRRVSTRRAPRQEDDGEESTEAKLERKRAMLKRLSCSWQSTLQVNSAALAAAASSSSSPLFLLIYFTYGMISHMLSPPPPPHPRLC